MPTLRKKIQDFAHQKSLWLRGDKILVGVSGGPDSVCLLSLLVKLAPKYKLQLALAHVNYGLRGAAAEKDTVLVRKLAAQHQLPLFILDKPSFKQVGNLEATLREIRYAFFETTRQTLGFDLIAVAHHADDQVETVLLRIMRGTGLTGLSAMQARTNILIRPLLATTRPEILAYLKTNNLAFRQDASNRDLTFERNRVRHLILPYLEKQAGPKLRLNLLKLAETAAADQAYLEQVAQKTLRKLQTPNDTGYVLSATALANLPPAIRRQCLRLLCQKLIGHTLAPELAQLAEMEKVIFGNKSKLAQAQIFGLKIERQGDKVRMLKN